MRRDGDLLVVAGSLPLLACIPFARVVFGDAAFRPLQYIRFGDQAPRPFVDMAVGMIHEANARILPGMLAHGQLPFWTPYAGAGMPLAADLLSSVFFPLTILAVVIGFTWTFILQTWLTFLFGYLYARSRLGFPLWASATTAAIYALSGQNIWYLWLVADATMWFPLLLYAYDGLMIAGIRKARTLWLLAVAGILLLEILGGFPESTLFQIGFLFVYGWIRYGIGSWKWSVLGTLSGLLLSGAVLVPFVRYYALASVFNTPQDGTQPSPLAALPMVAQPYAMGYPLDSYVSWFSGDFYLIGGYVGTAAVVLSLFALLNPRTPRWMKWGFGLAILISFLKNFTLLLNVITRIPGGDLILYMRFLTEIWSLGFAVLAGAALAYLPPLPEARRLALKATALTVYLLGIVWSAVLLTFPGHLQPFLPGIPWLAFSWAVTLAVLAGVWLLARPRRAAMLFFLVLVELSLYANVMYLSARPQVRQVPSYIRYLQAHEGLARVTVFGPAYPPQTLALYGIYDVRAFNGMYPARYIAFAGRFLDPATNPGYWAGRGWTGPVLRRQWPRIRRLLPYYRLAGVSYILAQPNSVPLPVLVRGRHLWLYRLPGALPRAFFVRRVTTVRNGKAAFGWLSAHPAALGREAVATGVPRNHSSLSPGRVRFLSYGATRVELAADVPRGRGFLVLTDTRMPGWRLTVNGHPAPLYTADGLFRGVLLPAGRSRLVMSYQPPGLREGLVAFLAGLLLIALSAFYPVGRKAGPVPGRRPVPRTAGAS